MHTSWNVTIVRDTANQATINYQFLELNGFVHSNPLCTTAFVIILVVNCILFWMTK